MAGGVSEATRAACHLGGFMVVVHSRRFRRAQIPLESAGDFVAVGRKPVKGTSVGNVIFTKIGIGVAWARDEVRRPGEGSQLVRVSEVDHVCGRLALRDGLRLNVPRDSAIEGHHVAGCCRSGGRDKHCCKAGEQQRDEKSCCWFELNVSIFHNLISFSCFGFVAVVLANPETQTVYPFLPETFRRVAKKVWNRCCVSRKASLCVRPSRSRTSHCKWHCREFCSGDATLLGESGRDGAFRRHASHLY